MLERIGARRLVLIAAVAFAVLIGGVAAANLAPNTVFYLTPSEAYARTVRTGQTVRLGGLVQVGSLHSPPVGREGFTNEYEFIITDGNQSVRVLTQGAIPGLLREGAGAIVEGSFTADATFIATQVIAKHDEVYTAPTAGATPAHRTGFP